MGELQTDILETHKVLGELNASMAQALQSSDKWTIASRFLSGTGLWAVQNKIRGVVSVIGEYQKGQTKMMESQKKNAELIDKLSERNERLAKSSAALQLATKGIDEVQKDYNDTINKVSEAERELRLAQAGTDKNKELEAANALKMLQEQSDEQREQYQLALKANDEIESLVSKHIADEEVKITKMQEQLKWYESELNLNPLSWKRKKRK